MIIIVGFIMKFILESNVRRRIHSTSVSFACSEPHDWSSCSDRDTLFGYCSGHSYRVSKPYPMCAFSSRCYSSSTPSSGCRSVLSFLPLPLSSISYNSMMSFMKLFLCQVSFGDCRDLPYLGTVLDILFKSNFLWIIGLF